MTKGQRIRLARESIGLNQTDLAKSAGISKQTLYKYENDIVTNIPSDTLEKLAYYCNCSPAYFLGWSSAASEQDDATADIEKAMQLYEQYKNAIPQVQSAVEALLKPSQSDS